jgi:hypothetical protein
MIIADYTFLTWRPSSWASRCRCTRTAKSGTKSITFEYRIEDSGSGQLLATGEVWA